MSKGGAMQARKRGQRWSEDVAVHIASEYVMLRQARVRAGNHDEEEWHGVFSQTLRAAYPNASADSPSEHYVTAVIRRHNQGAVLQSQAQGAEAKMDDAALDHLVALCETKPDMFLREYQWWLKFDLGLDVSEGTLVNAFKKLKLTLKDICYNWDEKYTAQNLQWRAQYLAAIAGVDPFKLHFVDEMGYNGFNLGRRRGRTRKGVPCRRSSSRVSRTHFTYQGITSIRPNKPPLIGNVVRGGCSTFHFLAFIFDPAVMATFERGDIMVMDNVRTHHGPVVEAMLRTIYTDGMGVHIIFLPPYSPELNPIELSFSKLKYFMRANFPQGVPDDTVSAASHAAARSVTHQCMYNYYRHCGYAA